MRARAAQLAGSSAPTTPMTSPASYVNVFTPAELVLLALAGLAIGVIGALLPASWAARARTATALRAE